MLDEFRKHIAASGRDDIVLHQTGCTGRCSREPIVGVFVPGQMPVKYERVDRELVHEIFTQHVQQGKPVLEHVLDGPIEKLAAARNSHLRQRPLRLEGPQTVRRAAGREARRPRASTPEQVRVTPASCFGACGAAEAGPVLAPAGPARQGALPRARTRPTSTRSSASTSSAARPVERLEVPGKTVGRKFFELYGDVAFFNRQSRVALRHNGVIDPESIEEYFHYRGFQALAKVLEKNDPQWVIDEITALEAPRPRRRRLSHRAEVDDGRRRPPRQTRYLICNADEGDPGAFMDRSMLESDPLNVVEGMIIGGFAIGAHQGFFYVRAEYPMAIERIENAIDAVPRSGACWARTSSARASISTWRSAWAPGRSSAARRRR